MPRRLHSLDSFHLQLRFNTSGIIFGALRELDKSTQSASSWLGVDIIRSSDAEVRGAGPDQLTIKGPQATSCNRNLQNYLELRFGPIEIALCRLRRPTAAAPGREVLGHLTDGGLLQS